MYLLYCNLEVKYFFKNARITFTATRRTSRAYVHVQCTLYNTYVVSTVCLYMLVRVCIVYCIPLHLLQQWQAQFLCGDSDYFWDRVHYISKLVLSFQTVFIVRKCKHESYNPSKGSYFPRDS